MYVVFLFSLPFLFFFSPQAKPFLVTQTRTRCGSNTYLQLQSVGLTAEKHAIAACKQTDPLQGSPWDLTCRMMRTEPQTAAADIS